MKINKLEIEKRQTDQSGSIGTGTERPDGDRWEQQPGQNVGSGFHCMGFGR